MLIPAAIVVVVVIATSGGGHSKSSLLPRLVSGYNRPDTGIYLRLPKGWSAANERGVVRLSSPGASAIIALAAFPDPSKADQLLLNALKTVLGEYSNTSIKHAPGTKLAGLPAHSAVVYGRNRRGATIRVLLAGATGHSHAYLLDVFTSQKTPGRELVEAQEIISTMRLTG
jgi:hypothetical protein